MRLNECGCGCGSPMGGCTGQEKELGNYMFFGNLKTIKMAIDAMMEMDPEEVDAILQDGHDWAADHIATSKDDIEEVAGFLINRLGGHGHDHNPALAEEPHHDEMPFVHTFESFTYINEAKKVKAKKKKDQDGDGDSDFADAKIAQYKAGGVPKKKAIAMSKKFNK